MAASANADTAIKAKAVFFHLVTHHLAFLLTMPSGHLDDNAFVVAFTAGEEQEVCQIVGGSERGARA